jgi:hypothetical protein
MMIILAYSETHIQDIQNRNIKIRLPPIVPSKNQGPIIEEEQEDVKRPGACIERPRAATMEENMGSHHPATVARKRNTCSSAQVLGCHPLRRIVVQAYGEHPIRYATNLSGQSPPPPQASAPRATYQPRPTNSPN